MTRKMEIGRRLFHICSAFIIVALIYYDILTPLIVFILLILGFILSMIARKQRIPILHNIADLIDRPEDLKEFPGKGAIFYGIGVLVVLLFFEKDIAMASIMILGLGDSIAPLVGRYGRIRHPLNNKKVVEGILVGMIAAAIGASYFVSALEASLAAVAAMIVESIGLKIGTNQIDDNITMPVVAGIVIWLVRMFL